MASLRSPIPSFPPSLPPSYLELAHSLQIELKTLKMDDEDGREVLREGGREEGREQ